MVRIRSPIVFVAIVALLTLGLAAPRVFAACGDDTLPGGSLDPCTVPKYVIPLVIPPVMNNTGDPDVYDIAVRQFQQQILPGGIWDTVAGTSYGFPATTVWGYGPAADPLPDSSALGGGVGIAPAPNSQFNYPAYTIDTESFVPVSVTWRNELTADAWTGGIGNHLPHLLAIDRTLHWANPEYDCRAGENRTDCSGNGQTPYDGPVPIVTHVHGAHVDPDSDGYPEAWWLPKAGDDWTPCTDIGVPEGCLVSEGTFFDSATGQMRFSNDGYADFVYRQDQPATTLWYHDHSLGMTRSNVYAGPAGFWLIRGGLYDRVMVENHSNRAAMIPSPAPSMSQTVLELNLPTNIRKRIREIPIVIQDRSFNSDGSLFYPANRAFFEGLGDGQTAGVPGNTGAGLGIVFAPTSSDVAPIWNPEAFFNVMVVNGVAWPNLDVAPTKYRFRFLNGCNSRFLILKLVAVPGLGDVNVGNPANWREIEGEFWQIGAEQGFLPNPVQLDQLLMGLAERADVIMDFEAINEYVQSHYDFANYRLYLVNVGPDEPFGGGEAPGDFDAADPYTTGQVMRFTLNNDLLVPQDARTTDPGVYRLFAEAGLGEPDQTQKLTLNERESEDVLVCANEDGEFATPIVQVEDAIECIVPGYPDAVPFGPTEALLGILDDSNNPIALKWTDTTGTSTPVPVMLTNGTETTVNVTENPTLGDTELWEIYNVTADAHPIHLHLVRFQVVNRQPLFHVDGEVRIPILLGDAAPTPAEPWETGYKDTVIAYPGEVTRIIAKFDIEGLYVWHCHIVEHEDNEMMRPYVVSAPAPPVAPAGVQEDFGFGGL